MISIFEQTYHNFRQLYIITEGGNAVDNVSEIFLENIKPTLRDLQKNVFNNLGISNKRWITVGSTGKKQKSGDLDIALENSVLRQLYPKITDDEKLLERFLLDLKFQDNIIDPVIIGGQIHFGYPIVGQPTENVQIDIIPSNNLKWTKFRYYGPSEQESKYKGAHRSYILRSLLRNISIRKAENLDPQDDKPHINRYGKKYPSIKYQYIKFGNDGIWSNVKTYRGKRGKIVLIPQKVEEESYMLTDDFQKALDIIFKKGKYKEQQFLYFEPIWNIIISDDFEYPQFRKDIIEDFVSQIEDDNDPKIKVPEEVKQYCKQNKIKIKTTK